MRRRRRGVVGACIAAVAVMAVVCPGARGLNPALDVSQYAHTAWKIRDGFTKGTIWTIAQTPDGYLWLGTEFGLVRFDGVRAMPWQPPEGQLPSRRVLQLLIARDGALWIGTDRGVASWKDGKLTLYPAVGEQAIFALVQDREGAVWVGGYALPPPGKLCAIRNGIVQCYGEDGTFGTGVTGTFEDRKGNLWLGTESGLWHWKPGPPKFYSLPDLSGLQALAEDVDGTLLFGWKRRIWRFVDGKTEAYPLPKGLQQMSPIKLIRDRDGGLWIATYEKGLVHVHEGRTDVFVQADGLSGNGVNTVFEDREGNVWLATFNGLDRFREFAVAAFGARQGLPAAYVGSVLADRDGSVWMGGAPALYRRKNGAINTYNKRDGKVDGQSPYSLFQDIRGRIWVSTRNGAGYLENDRFVPSGVTGKQVFSFANDTAGNLWMADGEAGLFRLSSGNKVERIPWVKLGHRDPGHPLVPDPLQGGLWIGFLRGGIAYLTEGQVRKSYTTKDGLGEGRVYNLQIERDGTLWAGTDGGLSRLKNGRLTTLNGKNGLPCDVVQWIMEDDYQAFWLSMPCGLVRIARPELDAWVTEAEKDKNTKRTIPATVFDNSDGVRGRTGIGGYAPFVTKSSDGRLWFSGYDGVNVVDPQHLPYNKLAPPVQIEQATADHKTYDAASFANGQLPALLRDLEIDYTALSLVVPEKVRFRYKLEGWDSNWQDAGNRRQAFYSNLPPRHYRFRVLACNNSGVWNETGASLDFSIAPAYYQTSWFLFLCAGGFLGLLWAAYQMRLRQVTVQVRHRMEGRLEERERIARDLHDTLLQSVQGLILKFHAVSKQCDEQVRQTIEKTLDHADEVMAEGRDRVRNLRATTMSLADLPAAFRRVADETAPGREALFKVVVEGKARELNPMILEESFSIGREALSNALIHSGGQNVEVEITYDARQFRLRINDDGRGVDPEVLEKGGRAGHWGLPGMKERARKMGATLEFWSRTGTGTEVELKIPGATAYSAGPAASKGFWLGRAFDRLRGRYE